MFQEIFDEFIKIDKLNSKNVLCIEFCVEITKKQS